MSAKRTTLILGVTLALLSLPFATAQEKQPTPAAGQNTPAETENGPANTQAIAKPESAKRTQGKPRKADIFKPSEEISEDLSVSFPVDI